MKHIIKIICAIFLLCSITPVFSNNGDDCKPAHIDATSGDQYTKVGETVTFWIEAKGEPASFTYTWKHDGKVVASGLSQYTIESVKKEDEGDYTCTVSNGCGSPATSVPMKLNTKCIDFDISKICGDKTDKISNSQYEVSGNVVAYNFLHFSNTVKVTNEQNLKGNGNIYLSDIPKVNNFILYSGNFDFTVADGHFKVLSPITSSWLLASLGTDLGDFQIINGGVEVKGSVDFWGNELEFDPLTITTDNIECKISKKDVDFGFITVDQFSTSYNLKDNSFGGELELTLKNKILKIPEGAGFGGGFLIKNGKWEEIKLSVSGSLPIGETGLAITKGTGEITNLQSKVKQLSLYCDIEPVFNEFFKVKPIVFSNTGFKLFLWDKKIGVQGGITVFEKFEVAKSQATIGNDGLKASGECHFGDIIFGNINLGATRHFVNGAMNGKVVISKEDIDYFTFSPIYFLLKSINKLNPIVCKCYGNIHNYNLNGGLSLNGNEISYKLNLASFPPIPNFGTNFYNLNKKLTDNLIEVTDENEEKCWGKLDGNLKSLTLNNKIVEPFEIDSEIPVLILSVTSDKKMPVISIVNPSKQEITGNNYSSFDGIGYYEVPSDTIVIFTLKQPQTGTWNLYLPNDGVDYKISMLGQTPKPSIQIDSISRCGIDSLKIKWTDNCLDEDAKITLFYDNDNSNLDGYLIKDSISEDNLCDDYIWDYSSIPDGQYYVYAIITSESGEYAYSYSKVPFTKFSSSKLASPLGFSAVPTDSSIILHWSKVDNCSQYLVYYSENTPVSMNSDHYVVMSDTTSVEHKNVKNGSEYHFFATALDSLMNESAPSDTVSVKYNNGQSIYYPIIKKEGYPNYAVVDSLFSFQVNYSYQGKDAISFTTLNAPSGLSVSKKGMVTWTPKIDDIGITTLKIKVCNSTGLCDSLNMDITVVNSFKDLYSINFDQDTYYCSENAHLEVMDYSLITSSLKVDTVQISISSLKNVIKINAIESTPDSKVFVAEIALNNQKSQNGIIVGNTDTLKAVYYIPKLKKNIQAKSSCSFEKLTPIKLVCQQPASIMYGDTVEISTDKSYTNLFWSDRTSGTTCKAYKSGTYSCITESSHGCLIHSDTIIVKVNKPKFTLQNVVVYEKDTIELKLSTEYLRNVGAITLYLDYDNTALQLLGYEILNKNLSEALLYDNKGHIGIAWNSIKKAINLSELSDFVLFRFVCKAAGSTEISFGNGCEVANLYGNLIPLELENANITIHGDCDYKIGSVYVDYPALKEGRLTIIMDEVNPSFQFSIDSTSTWSKVNVFDKLKEGKYYVAVKRGSDCLKFYDKNPIIVSYSNAKFSVSANSVSLAKDNGSNKNINITSNVSWTVSSDQSWLKVSPISGIGNGSITLTATENSAFTTRSATVTVTGTGVGVKTIAVTQSATEAIFIVSETEVSLNDNEGSSASVNITSNTAWNTISDQLWLDVIPASGSGNGTIILTASDNPTVFTRTAKVTISGTGVSSKIINVTQQAKKATLEISANEVVLAKYAGSNGTVDITSNAEWSATSDQAWLTTDPSSGTGNETITITATGKTSVTRTATITVSVTGANSQTIAVTQTTGSINNVTDLAADQIKLYPNPTMDGFRIDGLGENHVTLTISDVNGRLLVTKKVSDGEYISTGTLLQGVYLVKIITTEGITEKKLIKK
jgi:hypothetical protein